MTKALDSAHRSAEELLSDWRSAERNTMAAKAAARVAELGVGSAAPAEEAVIEVGATAQAAMTAFTPPKPRVFRSTTDDA